MPTKHGTDRASATLVKKVVILFNIVTDVVMQVLFKMSADELQYWILQKDPLRKQLQTQLRLMFKVTDTFVEEKEQWRKFYQKHFSLELNFADVVMLERPSEGIWRLLIIAQGLTLNQVYKSMSIAFKCWKYVDDLDASVTKNARDTKNAYAIWVRDSIEPDEKYLGKSTNQADPNMTIGVTLLERMIHEMIFFDETDKHLDIKGITFCSGSRNSDGDVPSMYWDSDDQEVKVDWCNLDYSNAKYGVREAVSI